MDDAARFNIELPDDLAGAVRALVASGEYASESDVIREGLELLVGQDNHSDEAEQWLRTTISARAEALDEGRTLTKSADELRASLAARARDQAA